LILSFGRQVMSIPEPAASLANQANALFVDEDFDGALDLYNQAITAASNVAELYVSRAALHIKMENFTAAISDANKAISIDPKNSKAYLRKGVACFQMEEYATAKTAFEKGKEIDPETAQFKTWIRKCNAELEEEMAVEETSAAPIAVGAAGGAASNSAPAATSPAPAPVPPPKPVQRFRHDFIQNQTHVTITVYLKGATQENCQVEFESRTLSLDWKISKDDNWQLSFDPLFDEIIPSESTTNYFTTKIEIKLKKKNTGKWDALERKEDEKALDELSEEVSST
jgi:suppressor of G2 allele of SKP1